MTTQDIFFEVGKASDTAAYFITPYRCTVRDVTGVVAANSRDKDFTIKKGNDTIGTLEVPDEEAYASAGAGITGAYSPDETNGDMVLDKGNVLTIATTDETADAYIFLELDPFGRKA